MKVAFIQPNQDLGTLKAKEKVKVSFKYEGDLVITAIHTSCGCTEAQWNKEKEEISVEYTPQDVPYHFIQQKRLSYESSKTVTVDTNHGTFILTFTAKVIQS